MSYAIYVEYSYYDGTYGAPEDGYLRDRHDAIIALASAGETEAIADAIKASSVYGCSYGQYAAHKYSIRQVVPHPRHVRLYEPMDAAEILGAESYIEEHLTV